MATATKQDLEARIAELEAQLASAQPAISNNVALVGMLRAVKPLQSDNPDAKFQVEAILTNNAQDKRGSETVNIDLPFDGIIASDNGDGPLATQLLELAQRRWVLVRVEGFWTPRGRVEYRNGYLKADGKQLRVRSLQVLKSAPVEANETVATPAEPFSQEPSSEAIPF